MMKINVGIFVRVSNLFSVFKYYKEFTFNRNHILRFSKPIATYSARHEKTFIIWIFGKKMGNSIKYSTLSYHDYCNN